MKLRKIEILGFKSFRSKTGVEIGDGVTAVVGPNGCGKSNIVDAIRWAMGSQSPRDLRGRAMEDIIFGGSENHRPMGFAEVSLTFENNPEASVLPLEWRDQESVKVTRRLFRNGDSDYEINGARARLRDVHDVFAGTGVSSRDAYSIIEQGRIGFVVSARPEERRVMIEEAAGITRYRNQRKLAARRLERTSDNLLRVGDIVREVARQVDSLERQAKRAAAARGLRSELRRAEMILHASLLRARTADHQRSLQDFRLIEERSQATQVEHAAIEARFEALRTQLQVHERTAADAAEAAYEARTRVELLDANIKHRERERTLNQQRKLEAQTRLHGDTTQLEALEQELLQARSAHTASDEDDDALLHALDDAEAVCARLRQEAQTASAKMQAAREELAACERTLARSGTRADALRAELRSLAGRHDEVTELLAEAAERAEALRSELAEAEEALEATYELVERAREELEASQHAERSARDALDAHQEALTKVLDARRRVDADLSSVEHLLASGAGLADGARWALNYAEAQRIGGVFGPLVARLRMDEGTEPRFGALFGELADAVVVDGRETALQLLSAAKDAGKSITLVTLESPIEGALAPWLHALAPVPRLLQELLEGVPLVDSLAGHTEGAALDASLFWTDGHGRYVFRSGAMAAEQRVKTQRERDRLHEQREQLEEDELSHTDAVDAATRALESARDRRQEAEERAQLLEDNTRRQRGACEDLRGRAQNAERQLQRARIEHEAAEERRRALESDLHASQAEAAAAAEMRDRLSDAVAVEQRVLASAEAGREAAEERLTTLKIQRAQRDAARQNAAERVERIEREHAATRGRLDEAQRTIADAAATDEALEHASAAEQKERVEWRETQAERDRHAAEAKQRFDAEAARARELEMQLSDTRRLRAGVGHDRERAMLAVERARNELQRASEQCTERFEMSADALLSEVGDASATPELEQEASSLARRLEALGAVNPAAEQEHAEALERHAFLEAQLQDLQTAVGDLETAIEKMDATCRTLFRETFDQVNAGFERMFPRLFRGGRARLELTDPSDLLATGVDIVAQPPGKRLQNLSLLSGGEKALTAAALIFAIFELRPSPICILDEVDAPLDEANVGRFAEMVREISDRSQFLVITHNTRTMEVADTLYGVTMQEPGVSKLVGVHLRGSEGVELAL